MASMDDMFVHIALWPLLGTLTCSVRLTDSHLRSDLLTELLLCLAFRMRMSFDDLRNEVAPQPSMIVGSRRLVFSDSQGTPTAHIASQARMAITRDNPQELEVFLFGHSADKVAAKFPGVRTLDRTRAFNICRGRRDFILFEPLDDAVQNGSALVVVVPLGMGRDLKQAQVYLASSLARWLTEEKVDGAGRPYGETKDEDPTLRKRFTRSQIQAIIAFGQG